VGLLEAEGRNFFVGRLEVWETEVGMDSGIGSDISLRFAAVSAVNRSFLTERFSVQSREVNGCLARIAQVVRRGVNPGGQVRRVDVEYREGSGKCPYAQMKTALWSNECCPVSRRSDQHELSQGSM
jgi:hypothetical protein